MLEDREKIRFISLILRVGCYIGIIYFVLYPVLNWAFVGKWDMGHPPLPSMEGWTTSLENLPFKLRLIYFLLELVQNLFFLLAYIALAKLLKMYEQFRFFTRTNVKYIRFIAKSLLATQIIQPFYIVFKEYVRSLPHGQMHIPYYNLFCFKIIFLSCLLYLISLIIVEGGRYEEEFNGIV